VANDTAEMGASSLDEDLEVWIEATRRLLSIPQRTVKQPDGAVVCAVELRLLQSILRFRQLYRLKTPHIILESEAKLVGKRLSQIVDAPIRIEIDIPSSEESAKIEKRKEEMQSAARTALPCPMCGASLDFKENHAGAWLQHPYQSECMLAAARIEKEMLDKWNCREKLVQLARPAPDPRFPDDGRDYGEAEKENAEEAAFFINVLANTKPCPFCRTRLIFRMQYGIPGLHHPDNGCFLGGQNYCMKEAVDLWNTRTTEKGPWKCSRTSGRFSGNSSTATASRNASRRLLASYKESFSCWRDALPQPRFPCY